MATLNEQNALSRNSHLLNRVAAALAKAAEDVMDEGIEITDHTARFIWATTVLLVDDGPRNEAIRSIWLVIQDTTITDGPGIDDGYAANLTTGGNVTDVHVQTAVDRIINFLARVEV